ncbi:AraC family transcriptional regulator [Ruminococcus sp. OA3]|uniref:AraC family transcriptional regulator n=1 Tax=Ruminococcus sp. OA3 TaxID=2914164 RepID=UPI001F06592C|nr:AraC family transcriptional regulator [Ruminococcus sp. OA3]MCH1983137.1 AraC family transcriptional regulator [Ruminococcus sp. OA3]
MREEIFAGGQLTPLAKSGGCSVYQAKNETGEGTMTIYEVFPGVTLTCNDFHMRYFDSEFVPGRELFCIDHCREGRLEYPALENAYSYVESGDMKLDRRLTHKGHFELPLSHYHGIMVSFDMKTACASLAEQVRDFPVDLVRLREKYCPDKFPVVLHGLESIEHIFGELYAVPDKIKRPYFKIKILELLLFLEALEIPQYPEERPYFYKTQVEKVKAIQLFLAEHMDQNFTQEELSSWFDIPLTPMKNCFKSVFGSSIGTWILRYRMNHAAELLCRECKLSVTEIAGRAGYDSPSKFAIAFRKVMGMSPTEYREQRK